MNTPVIQGFQLSQQQQRLWALQREGISYEAQCAIRLDGELNPNVLRDALCLVVERCEVLRTTFQELPAVKLPVQVVADFSAPEWRTLNLSEHDATQHDVMIEKLLQQEARAPFDFESGPLVKSLLLTLAPRQHLLILTLPALIADTGTLNKLFGELADCYAAGLSGTVPESMPLPYVQYAAWQQELFEDLDAEEGRQYWRKQNLATLCEQTLPGTAVGPASLETAPVALTREVVTQLEAVASPTWLLTCWHTLLWRLTGEEEIVVGDSYDGREFEELSNVFGPLAKSLPVSVRLSPSLRFTEALALIEKAVDEARAWQEYFVWPRASEQQIYCPFCFEFAQWPGARHAGGVAFSIYKLHSNADRFHLKLSCVRNDDSLALELRYDASRFPADEIIRLTGRLSALLTNTLTHPETPLAELDILSSSEKQQLLVEVNNTSVAFPEDRCLHELFAAQVQKTPDVNAVVYQHERLTYAELNARAETLAARLRAHGVGPETIVGLCAERGLDMIVGVLGIWKAGGAYLPLDPTYPAQRIKFMLDDAGVSVLLTQRRLSEGLPENSAEVLFLDDSEAMSRTGNPATSVVHIVTPDNLAYVIYTSGSTGQPKGVMIQHRSAVNLAEALRRAIYAEATEQPLRVGLNAPLAFDASVKQLVQLLFGHTLYIVPEELRPDPSRLLDFVNESRLDVLDLTPSQLKLLLETGTLETPTVLIGGEAIDATLWALLSDHSASRFCNLYGPTECTVDATCCEVRRSPLQPGIGRPLANVRVYLLDKALRPAPIGIAGELYIGGPGVARGYLNRPELTAQRFIPNSFSEVPGARLYRSGDRARFLADGNLEFLGRVDEQVKLNGYRIELGEIEATLTRHENIRSAVVAVRETDLVAYVVPRHTTETLTQELRELLRETLPEFMIPSSFVFLETLPLTRHGKIDRVALPAPDAAARRQARYVTPRNEVEHVIAGIWQKVLQVEQVGREDNFFDLGGHSLAMVKVHAELRTAFSRDDFSIVELFKYPTISLLGEYFTGRNGGSADLRRVQNRVEKRRQAARRRQQTVVS
ncbi:MAG TPA: amino acid adenylation domain-containing protein [Pyrinomonadaceae bacterium]|nr:amino acid adenylation domain-containing protein [Pyrinomonadaceae bacterium]